MNPAQSRFLALSLCCLLSLPAFSEAPVVDDSENFAILDEQQVAMQQPVAKAQLDENYPEEEIALAHDSDLDGSDNALLNKLKGMQQEIQELRGQLEVQTHDLKLLQQQQLAFYKDIDNRLHGTSPQTAKTESPTELTMGPKIASTTNTATPPPAVITQPSTVASHSNPADEQISYLAAYDLVKNKRFDDALVAMQTFINKYPEGGYTANAQYWLGELYMVKKNYAQAIAHFETVLTKFPTSSKAAACSLKIGYALAASGKEPEARHRLQQVLKNYPDTPTAELAATKLRSINAS